jgi:hypothetical protein
MLRLDSTADLDARGLPALSLELDISRTVSRLHSNERHIVERPNRVSQNENGNFSFTNA